MNTHIRRCDHSPCRWREHLAPQQSALEQEIRGRAAAQGGVGELTSAAALIGNEECVQGIRAGAFVGMTHGAPELLALPLPTGSGVTEGILPIGERLYVSVDGGDYGTPACKDRKVSERAFTVHRLR